MSDLAKTLSGVDEPERVFLGRAVKDGKVRFLSPSQVRIYSPQYQGGCPRRWAFIYPFGRKEPETGAEGAGKEYAKSVEHYLTTGEDVLLPVLRAAKHFFPEPGPDLEVEQRLSDDEAGAIKLREQFLAAETPAARIGIAVEMLRVAGLTANNIPIIGAADCRHRRGEYIDAQGILQKEDPGMRVTKVDDLKTTSRIADYWSKHGEGKFYAGYAKSVEEILADVQMLSYGKHELNRHPETTHVRLGHIYAQTKHGFAAAKRSGLLSAEEINRRWSCDVEPVVREMEQVARISKPEEAPVNLSSCIQFHKPCPHSEYCDRPKGTVLDLFQIKKGDPMADHGLFSPGAQSNGATAPATQAPQPLGLFGGPGAGAGGNTNNAPVGLFSPPSAGHLVAPPPLPPMSDADRAAAEAAERARLMAEDAARAAMPTVGQINPADGKVPDAVDAASAVSTEGAAEIQDPALKAKVEEHARLVAERAAKEAAAQPPKKGGRCPASETTLALNREQIARAKPVICPGDCGKVWKKVPDDAFTSDFQAMMIPKHNIPKEAKGAAPPPLPTTTTPPPLPAQSPPPLPPVAAGAPMTAAEANFLQAEHGLPQSAGPMAPPPIPPGLFTPVPQGTQPAGTIAIHQAAAAVAAIHEAGPPPLPNALIETGRYQEPPSLPRLPAGGADLAVYLYTDMTFEKGPQPQPLEVWFQDIVKTLTDAAKLDDIRYAPDSHQLAYGRWRPALQLAVKANPLPPGEYLLRGVAENELKQVVVQALELTCERVVRGGR